MNDFNLGIVVIYIVLLSWAGTYIKKLLRDNKTKDIAIVGLREIIRLLEKKIK